MKSIRGRGTSGVSVLEALLALTLLALLVPGLWTVVVRHRTAGTMIAARAEAMEGIRTLTWLLDRELALGKEGLDWTAQADSVVLRAFRGMAVIDSVAGDSVRVFVCYAGVRRPDPAKDSVLVVGLDGSWSSRDLLARTETASACSGGRAWGTAERWSLSGPPGVGGVARVFERGSYHFAGRALRYRRGEGGRQPLTPEFLSTGQFQPLPGGWPGLGWEVRLQQAAAPGTGRRANGPSAIWRGAGG